jgi:transcriptional regulator with XRE-family HTH domain
MKDRINTLIQSENLTPAKFADELGVQRSSISHILSGRNLPSYDLISKILTKFPKIEAEWLILGNGSQYKSTQSKLTNVIQNDLFQSAEKPMEKTPESNVNPIKIDSPDKQDVSNKGKFTNVNYTNRIVIFYNDNTFKEYFPSNK